MFPIKIVVGRGVQLVPATAGILILAYNLEGIGGDLKLKRDVCVDVFLGKIKKWNDLRIKAANPGLHLPSDDIKVLADNKDLLTSEHASYLTVHSYRAV
jgi:ABC-type phosphate transport system substrate-binding protein